MLSCSLIGARVAAVVDVVIYIVFHMLAYPEPVDNQPAANSSRTKSPPKSTAADSFDPFGQADASNTTANAEDFDPVSASPQAAVASANKPQVGL